MPRDMRQDSTSSLTGSDKLTRETLDLCLELVRQQYLADGRPWVIGYSGGKDSTCVLQIVWNALLSMPAQELKKPIYIIASDTFVESPAVEQHLNQTLEQINAAAQKTGVPFTAHKVFPPIDESFWVNLIGRGYPAPYKSFRWCTDRMKIKPATAFIQERIAEYGEVIVLLGARKAESSSRAQVMRRRKEMGTCLFRHNSLPNAWVFTPIEDWSTEDVWTYLTTYESPWGGDNRELVAMYRNAQAGECPLVIDRSTPSCGGGRFGCWVCTVVERDRTMESMIDNGEEWLQSLLDFRNWLASTRDPANKARIREPRRRTGKIEFFGSEAERKLRYGPFKLSFRKEILTRVLKAQVEARKAGPNSKICLIRDDELHKIRQIWLHDEGDWEDSLPAIHDEITGEHMTWLTDDWSGMGGAEKRILDEVSRQYRIPPGLLTELMNVEREYHGMSRRAGVYDQLERIVKKDWRSLEEAWADQGQEIDGAADMREKSGAH